jgi:hypothetical protein
LKEEFKSYSQSKIEVKMQPTKEQVIEIIKDNFWISDMLDFFSRDEVNIEFLNKSGDTKWDFDISIKTPTYETILPLEIDYKNYDEKFIDVNKYEVDDMGLEINIVERGAEVIEDLTEASIWKYLFFEKEPISVK